MPAEGNEAVTLKQLKMLSDSLTLAGGARVCPSIIRRQQRRRLLFCRRRGHLPKFGKSFFYGRFSPCHNRD